ncbi:MAG: sulfatase [Kiritimatiellae bacterium]|nr:sulfatase [Kiritimatiellia bacterium]
MRTSRRQFLFGAGAATAACAARSAELVKLAQDRRLNVLFIMTDDHAAHAISAYGSRVAHTPHIDAMAREGMIFSSVMCTNPICTPSRAGILTGRYSHKNGVPVFNSLSPEIETVGGYMRAAGYYTGFIGKWHCGGPASIRNSDWDKWYLYEGQGTYNDPWYHVRNADGTYGRLAFPGEYATENITRLTKGVLDEALKSGKPFFVMMHHKAPHRNWIPSEKYRLRFRALTLRDIPIPPTLFDTWEGRATPIRQTAMTLLRHMRLGLDLKVAEWFAEGHVFEFEGRTYYGQKDANGKFLDRWPVDKEGREADDRAKTAFSYLRYMQDYLACCQSVDDSVGEMNAYLEEKGVARDTLVVYTSDQGFFLGDHGLYDKRFIMEETLRMPFIAKCPALIRPGSTNDDLIANIDFAPTFIDLAGAAKPAAMQGASFLANLRGRTPPNWRQALYARYYVEGGEHNTAAWYGVRTKTEKLVYYYKRDEWEYFDLAKDPEELRNGYADPACRERVAALKRLLAELRAEVQDEDQFRDCHEYSL